MALSKHGSKPRRRRQWLSRRNKRQFALGRLGTKWQASKGGLTTPEGYKGKNTKPRARTLKKKAKAKR